MAHLLVAEVHSLHFGGVLSPRRRAASLLRCGDDAAWLALGGAPDAPAVRRPVRYEGLHAERQLRALALAPSVGRQVQLIGPLQCALRRGRGGLPRCGRGRRSLRRIHDARLRCHTTSFHTAAPSPLLSLFSRVLLDGGEKKQPADAQPAQSPAWRCVETSGCFTHGLASPSAIREVPPSSLVAPRSQSARLHLHVTPFKGTLIGQAVDD